MKKRLPFTQARIVSLLSIALMLCLTTIAWSQDTTATSYGCGTTGSSHIVSIPASGGGTPGPAGFSSSAIIPCGKVDMYFADINAGTGTGFDDPTLVLSGFTYVALGTLRVNTVCAALTYIQSVFDFSHVSDTDHIRLYIDTSFAPGTHPSNSSVEFAARAILQYDTTVTGLVKGWMNDYINSPSWNLHDSLPTNYFHGYLQYNFDSVYSISSSGVSTNQGIIQWQSDYSVPFVVTGLTTTTSCQKIDMMSVSIHEITHNLGWVSLISFPGSGSDSLTPHPAITTNPHIFTALDWSLCVGNNSYPLALTKVLSGTTTTPVLDTTVAAFKSNNNYWINDSAAPNNHPVYSGGYPSAVPPSFLSHMDDQLGSYTERERISPGDAQNYVMAPGIYPGVTHRTYTKGELQNLVNVLGYRLNSSYVSANPYIYSNHAPYSRKMGHYSILFGNNYGLFTEEVPYDDTLTNNIGSSITINIDTLIARGDVTDSDAADVANLYFDSTTLVNFRGCGSGGNNHVLLHVSSDAKTITYTPRANFYGKTQLGVNISDGKEDGSFEVITIEVYKGTNVSAAPGTNMVCNPGFEEGSEVKIAYYDETKNNAVLTADGYREGRWQGIQFSDCHPYGFLSDYNTSDVLFSLGTSSGTVIGNTWTQGCGTLDTSTSSWGSRLLSWPTGGITFNDNPWPKDSVGNRYQFFGTPAASYYYLADTVRACKPYILEFDLFRPDFAYNSTLPLRIGLADHIVDLRTTNPLSSFNYYVVDTVPFTTHDWVHTTIHLKLCGAPPSTVLYLARDTTYAVQDYFHIDNLSLKEDTTALLPLTVTVSQSPLPGCKTLLTSNVTNAFCKLSYDWNATAATALTDSIDTVNATINATYTVTVTDGCRDTFATSTILYTAPAPITGLLTLCAGSTAPLTETVPGGSWSSNNTSVATVGSTTGIVSGVTGGTAVITYIDACGLYVTAVVTVNPLPSTFGGPSSVCTGSSVTLTNTHSGGSWLSSNFLDATIGSGSGLLTGMLAGVVTITYTLPTGCLSTTPVTVNTSPPPILGITSVCTGATISLADPTTPTGTWSSSNTAYATVGSTSGTVTGVAVGNPTITYLLSTGCYAAGVVTVNQTPSAISGTPAVCVGATTSLSNSYSGGTWSSSNPSYGTVDGSGNVSGIAAGTIIITYTLPAGCYITVPVTINALPSAIGGVSPVCTGATISLTNSESGGIWSSSNTSYATVNSTSGTVTGVAVGTPTITYTLAGGCFAVAAITVNQTPAAITGMNFVCTGATITLADATSGGSWSSSATGTATVTSGTVSGVASGTAIIDYAMPSGCFVTKTITVNSSPSSISGLPTAICQGSSVTLTDPSTGGTWSSSNIYVASVGTTGIYIGRMSGTGAGTATITYSYSGSCYVTGTVTVNPSPAVILGVSGVCAGSTIGLSDAVSGGTWGSLATSIATVGSTGAVTGVLPGTAIILYVLPAGCSASKTITVNALPSVITGSASFCTGSTITLHDSVSGGVWSSSGITGAATVGSSSGVVTGTSGGTVAVRYTISDGCYSTATVTVNAGVPAISGLAPVCVGSTLTLSDATSGGTWSSESPAYASIGSGSGIVTGVTAGTVLITYTLGTGCLASATMTVIATPAAITGTTNVCVSATVMLSDTSPGGIWASGLGFTSMGGAGAVTGVTAGVDTIYYIVAGCAVTIPVTVNPSPMHILGMENICLGMGTILSDATSGGTWTSGNTAVATIGSTGTVSTVSAGTAPITYTLPGGCYKTATVTVNTEPTAIGGTTMLCAGTTISMTDMPYGGTWTSSAPSIAAIGSATGYLTGLTGGTATITYTSADCSATVSVTVHPAPAPISGATLVCLGTPGFLSDVVLGGTWSSSSPPVATVGSGTGTVTGVSAGTALITYTLMPGHCMATEMVTVAPAPAAIAGTATFCGTGVAATLTDVTTGGHWTSSNTAVAIVGSVTGNVLTTGSGSATITYTLPGGCYSTFALTVGATDTAACVPCHIFSSVAYTQIGASGIINTSIPAGSYYIANNVTIMGSVNFTDAIVFIAPGVTVSVNQTSSLILKGSHLFSCARNMWQGIVLESVGNNTGTITLEGDALGVSTLVEDAITGVDAENPGYTGVFITCNNAIFNKNNTGIKIGSYSISTIAPTTYAGLNMINTVFTSRVLASSPGSWASESTLVTPIVVPSPLIAPYAIAGYAGQPCHNNAVTTGINLTGIGTGTWPNYGTVQVGEPGEIGIAGQTGLNLFDTLNIGVAPLNANVTFINNSFAHMAKNNAATGGGGIGIYAGESDGHNYQLTVEEGVYTSGFSTTYSPNYFWNCAYGVEAFGYYHITGLNSQIITTQSNTGCCGSGSFVSSNYYGFFVQTSNWDTLNLSLNTIINTANGIAVKLPGSTIPYEESYGLPGKITISNNNIRAAYSASVTAPIGTGYIDKPIWVENTIEYLFWPIRPGGPPPPVAPQLNTDENIITGAYNGIYVNGTSQQISTSNTNTINLIEYPTKNNQYGVSHNNLSGDQVVMNTITGVDYSDTAWYGVLESGCNGFSVNCNGVSTVGKAFEFDHCTLQSHWIDNTMTNSGMGFVLGGIIGPQTLGASGSPCLNTWETIPGSGFSWTGTHYQTYTHYGVSPTSSPMYVYTWSPSDDPVNNWTSAVGPPPIVLPHVYGWAGGTSTSITGSGNGIVASTVAVDYHCVPSTIISCCGGGAGLVAQNNIPYSQWAVQHSWNAQFVLWEALLQDSAMADTSAILASFMAMARNSRFALFTQIDSDLSIYDTSDAQLILDNFSVDSMANAQYDTTTGAQMADDTTADAIVVNYRTYYQMYLHYLESVMSNADSAEVTTLANLCPITGGGCVYKARALYDIIYDTLVFFPNNCNDTVHYDSLAMRHSAPGKSPAIPNGDGGITQAAGGQQYILFPNPNTGNFTLQQGVSDQQPVIAEMWDVTGRIIYKDYLHFDALTTNLQVVNAVPGLYLLQLTDSKGRMFKFKFIVE